jgi:acetyl-CoA carboxylase biotin carboxylase subunit
MGEVAVRAAKAVGYRGAGTVEFLLDARREFFFLEMNTRIQVEHPVTELVTGLDLVRMQLEVARGEPLRLAQADVVRRGHAIEARLCAEDPAKGFLPSPGRVAWTRGAGGPGVREDSGIEAGAQVTPWYDPLLAKLCAWAPTRDEAIARLERALGEWDARGIAVNRRWILAVLRHPEFRAGRYDTRFAQLHAKELLPPAATPAQEDLALAAAAIAAHRRAAVEASGAAPAARPQEPSAWVRVGRARALARGAR